LGEGFDWTPKEKSARNTLYAYWTRARITPNNETCPHTKRTHVCKAIFIGLLIGGKTRSVPVSGRVGG
jgi:hypothetical protein